MDNMINILNSIQDVPAMPNVIVRALSVVRDPESGAKELAKIISCDQSLSTKVLTLVNSAYYGFAQQVSSISRAISLMGMSKAKNIILAVAMKPMLVNQGDKDLWSHAIATAVGCEHVARYYKTMDVDEAFTIGFLHDLGKIVLNMKDANTYQQVKNLVSASTNTGILEIEQMYFGTNHCQIGSLLAKRWQLPLLVNNAIKYHHAPNSSSMPIPCTLVYMVDALVKENFVPEMIDENIIKHQSIRIEQLQFMRESIMTKAAVLLNELAN